MTAHQYEIYTRFTDQDRWGRISEVSSFVYLEEARGRLWSEPIENSTKEFRLEGGAKTMRYRDLRKPGARTVVASQKIDYELQLRHNWEPEPLLVHLWVTRVGVSSCNLGFRLMAAGGGPTYATGRTVVVETTSGGTPTPLTSIQRAVLETWRDDL